MNEPTDLLNRLISLILGLAILAAACLPFTGDRPKAKATPWPPTVERFDGPEPPPRPADVNLVVEE